MSSIPTEEEFGVSPPWAGTQAVPRGPQMGGVFCFTKPTKWVASWLSSVHFAATQVEDPLREERWRRLVGEYIKAHYSPVARFGAFVVLTRSEGQR